MIGDQPTGNLTGVRILAAAHQGLTVIVDGKPAHLAVVLDGQIVAVGAAVANEVEAAAVNNYRNFLKGQGHLKVISPPLLRAA